MNTGSQIKVLFVQCGDEDSLEIESLWCRSRVAGGYVIDNIPFVAKNVSLGDVIDVALDNEEQAYYFEALLEESGNTTVRMVVPDVAQIEEIRKHITGLGCESEAFLERHLIAVNVPARVDYTCVKSFLDAGELEERWFYEESCLAHAY